jgi:hypothetical protein
MVHVQGTCFKVSQALFQKNKTHKQKNGCLIQTGPLPVGGRVRMARGDIEPNPD